ncbi:MAG: CehA/McbA family metallohydrolase [Halanaerobiales bacterium]|nr:CehA/McbA family metallohydrolase [Halanaerobiales bacterium]
MLKIIFYILISIAILLFFTALFVYLYYIKRARKIDEKVLNININIKNNFDDFKVHNPYDYEGKYFKAQLHSHTKESDGKLEVNELIKEYKNRGYDFLAITDHDKITINKEYDDNNFKTITGEELTVINPFWPLGRHLNRIGVKKRSKYNKLKDVDKVLNQNNITVINHPATESGLGTQRWDIDKLLELENIKFIEIANHFSDQMINMKYWHILLNKYGNQSPIWGLAVDDAHNIDDIDKNWIMVKADNFTEKDLLKALTRGSFYSTQGPEVEFFVEDNIINVTSNTSYEISFYGGDNKLLKSKSGFNADYKPKGNEDFIRLEIVDKDKNKKLWSQPFWLYNN